MECYICETIMNKEDNFCSYCGTELIEDPIKRALKIKEHKFNQDYSLAILLNELSDEERKETLEVL